MIILVEYHVIRKIKAVIIFPKEEEVPPKARSSVHLLYVAKGFPLFFFLTYLELSFMLSCKLITKIACKFYFAVASLRRKIDSLLLKRKAKRKVWVEWQWSETYSTMGVF